jgi:hypothetical protein
MYGVQPGKEGVVKVGFMAARPSQVMCSVGGASPGPGTWLRGSSGRCNGMQRQILIPYLSGGNGCEGWVTWAPGIEGCGRGRATGVLQREAPGSKGADLH